MKRHQDGGATSTVGVLVLVIAVFLWADPYTHGQVGGEYAIFNPDFDRLPVYRWQISASIFLVVLLLTGLSAFVRGSVRMGIRSFVIEFGFFILLNAVYILRDGVTMRGTAGDEGTTQPAIVTLGGLVCRLALLAYVARARIRK